MSVSNPKTLVIFLTHNFKPVFVNSLKLLNDSMDESMDCVVLFDNSCKYENINFSNIETVKIDKLKFNYDHLNTGHNMYIQYLYNNKNFIEKKLYDYIWIIENDVYYHNNIKDFIDLHKIYFADLLCPEIGLRTSEWVWSHSVYGLPKIQHNIGITCPIFRISKNLAHILVYGLMNNYFGGFFEALLPNLCLAFNCYMTQFLPETVGLCNTFKTKTISLIEQDITNNTEYYIENKLYHPIKL